MNDPHVEALHYELKHAPNVDFDRAPPLEYENELFALRVEDYKVRVTMKEHFADPEEARAVVQPYIEAWEVSAGLSFDPGIISLKYLHPEIIDRQPGPSLYTDQDLQDTSLTT